MIVLGRWVYKKTKMWYVWSVVSILYISNFLHSSWFCTYFLYAKKSRKQKTEISITAIQRMKSMIVYGIIVNDNDTLSNSACQHLNVKTKHGYCRLPDLQWRLCCPPGTLICASVHVAILECTVNFGTKWSHGVPWSPTGTKSRSAVDFWNGNEGEWIHKFKLMNPLPPPGP